MFIACIMSFSSCTKNDMELDVWQRGCKKFKIKEPSYDIVQDQCSGALTVQYNITFSYTKNDDCIFKIVSEPDFQDENSNTISPTPDFDAEVLKTEATLNTGDKKITYPFNFTFANASDRDDYNHTILSFHTENEIGNASNSLRLRLLTSCSKVTDDMYTTNSNEATIPPSQTFFTIRLWDDAAEDGDIVSVYLNGEWIILTHSLLNAGTEFSIPTSKLNSGETDLVVFAINEGDSGPNTVAISIDGKEIEGFQPGLETGEAVTINF